MKIHHQLKEEHLTAYLLECMKAETLLHMYELDEQQVENYLVKTIQLEEEKQQLLKADYHNMIAEIKAQKLKYGQHIAEVEELLEKLEQCHLFYLKEDKKYLEVFQMVVPYLDPEQMSLIFGTEIKNKTAATDNPVAVGLHYVHNYLMARLEGHELSKGIALIIEKVGVWLQELNKRYHKNGLA